MRAYMPCAPFRDWKASSVVLACMHTCVHACVRACVRACVHRWMHAWRRGASPHHRPEERRLCRRLPCRLRFAQEHRPATGLPMRAAAQTRRGPRARRAGSPSYDSGATCRASGGRDAPPSPAPGCQSCSPGWLVPPGRRWAAAGARAVRGCGQHHLVSLVACRRPLHTVGFEAKARERAERRGE